MSREGLIVGLRNQPGANIERNLSHLQTELNTLRMTDKIKRWLVILPLIRNYRKVLVMVKITRIKKNHLAQKLLQKARLLIT